MWIRRVRHPVVPALALLLALTLASCLPAPANPLDSSADVAALVGAPALGTAQEELDTAGFEAARAGALTRYTSRSADYGFAVCTLGERQGQLVEVTMTRTHPEVRRFLSPEGVTFNASAARVRALLNASRRVKLDVTEGGDVLRGRYEDGLVFAYRFERQQLASVTVAYACS